MSRIALPELSIFITVAEQRNFSAAARELGVSTSALSHSIRKLEERLGIQLFIRTTRSVALTEAGKQLFLRSVPAINDLEQAIHDLNSSRNRPSGTIRISSAEAGAKLLIRNMLPNFFKTYPDIHVEFVVDTRYIDIVADGFSAGIRLLEDVPLDMAAIPFGPDEIRIAAVASPDYLEQHGTPTSPDDLKKHQCIRFRFSSGALYHWDLEQQERSMNIDVNGPMTLGNTNLMVEAALTGIGIAWVPDYHVHEHIKQGRLVQLLADWSPKIGRTCLYYPLNRQQPQALKLFCDALRAWSKNSNKAQD
ncbi:LysR family transcriptional regulator [Bartonella sp. HY406]|uniref:LysR family transcriptional regulator n=1 Tax=Bartonella sp. HY406 TaxID=2979331 RepID=UPI0021C5A548|nr:LysR family transcriptional regulator [Bartonella sp. HY406]UXN02468.1 LysR family transcriptional regulator [Bartonella sp. HY406]